MKRNAFGSSSLKWRKIENRQQLKCCAEKKIQTALKNEREKKDENRDIFGMKKWMDPSNKQIDA